MGNISWENINEKLIENVPELKKKYEEEVKWWGSDKPGAHNIYGAVLCPYFEELLLSKTIGQNEEILIRIFKFMEELANNQDVKIQEVVYATVLEYLMDNKPLILKAKEYMGDTTLKFLRELYNFWE